MKDLLLYLYPISQALTFFIYYPHIKTVVKSQTAEAINVPAQFGFFTIGAIAAMYMLVVNEDKLSCLIICGHIFIGNLAIGLIAWHKQRKERERRKKDPNPEGPPPGKKENPQADRASRRDDPVSKRQTVSEGDSQVVRQGDPLHLQSVTINGSSHPVRKAT